MSETSEGLFGPHDTITEIRPDAKDPTLVHVMVSRKRRFNAPAAEAESIGLVVGAPWTASMQAACDRAMEVRRALRRAAALLGDKARARADVEARLLAAGFAPEIVGDTIARLEARGLIDDRKLAADRAGRIAEGPPLGDAAILAKVGRGGVDPEAAAEAAGALAGNVAQRAYGAAVEIEAGLERTLPAAKRWRRVLAGLARRGFDEDAAMEAARRVLGEPPGGDPE